MYYVHESVIKDAMLAYLLEQGFINKQPHRYTPNVLHVHNDWSALMTDLSH